LYTGDCLNLFSKLEEGTIDLIFADPPFNIGYDYDIYDDRRDAQAYLKWTMAWAVRSCACSDRAARSGWRSAKSLPPS